MNLSCVIARPMVIASVMDGTALSDRVAAHRGQCLKCQAAEARTKAMGRTLRTWEPEQVDSIGLAERVEPQLDGGDEAHKVPVKTVAVSTVVVAALAVVVVRKLRRRVG